MAAAQHRVPVFFDIDGRSAKISRQIVVKLRLAAGKIGRVDGAAARGLGQGGHQFIKAPGERPDGRIATDRFIKGNGLAAHRRLLGPCGPYRFPGQRVQQGKAGCDIWDIGPDC